MYSRVFEELKFSMKSIFCRVGQDEYEPAMSVPQFVVTLTGLDSNMFPKDDVDDLVDMLTDDLEAGN